jgi:hypothetical protein
MTDPQSAAGPLYWGIPLALWVAIIVPVLSLLGVWRSNKNARENLEKQLMHSAEQQTRQLAHDANQRDLERKMSLRREVYLQAAAALAHSNASIGRVTIVEYDQNKITKEFTDDLATISRVHIVGSNETVEAVMNYVNELGAAFMNLVRRRVPLAVRMQNIETHVALMNRANADRERLLATMQQYNLQGIKDSEKWNALNVQFGFANQQFEAQSQLAARLRIDQMKEQLAVSEYVREIAERNTILLSNAVLAVRNEMEMPLDKKQYERQWAAQREKLDEGWRPFRADMERVIQGQETELQAKTPPVLSPP